MPNVTFKSACRAYVHSNATRCGLRGYRTDTGQTINKPLIPKAQPLVRGDDGIRTFRARQHGGRSLPLPPLLDPIVTEAKERYHAAKKSYHDPKPSRLYGPKTKMQAEMEMNPYAQALATPIRQCQLTSARLPSHFLQAFTTHLQRLTANNNPSNGPPPRLSARLAPELKDGGTPDTLRSPGRSYLLADRSILDFVTARKKWPVLVSEHMKAWITRHSARKSNSISVQKDVQWDPDTAERLLVSMRESVQGELSLGIRHKYVLPLSTISDLEAWQEREKDWRIEDGPVMGLFTLKPGEDEGVAHMLRIVESSESKSQGCVEVHNLADVLGKEDVTLSDLGASWALQEKGVRWLGLLESTRSVGLWTAVMRLEAYLRESKGKESG
ncbi:hypothetical protein B0A55_12054 [Friedmanniomyces simplex]|uniref:Uncharacterized protein n=1 Tax=Friedmanniomyces simplex TaxID=329884 RepID=A0A4U0WFY9_9PEZI|nr:hypothetical protein B0A55_12054 [Friedmanniomyces simplex]